MNNMVFILKLSLVELKNQENRTYYWLIKDYWEENSLYH